MKKKFYLQSEKIAPERQVESVKHQIKKYMARERRKPLPENYNYWGFNCKIGPDEESLRELHANEIRGEIDKIVEQGKESFFIVLNSTPENFKPKDTSSED